MLNEDNGQHQRHRTRWILVNSSPLIRVKGEDIRRADGPKNALSFSKTTAGKRHVSPEINGRQFLDCQGINGGHRCNVHFFVKRANIPEVSRNILEFDQLPCVVTASDQRALLAASVNVA